MEYKKIILNELLNKYERSKSYLQTTNRRIMIEADNIKDYKIEDYETKNLFHNIVKELKKKNIIDFNWVAYEEDNLLDKIWLIKENVSNAYKEINRDNPKEEYKQILEELEKQTFDSEWITKFAEEMKEDITKRQKENSMLPKDKTKEILIALKEIDGMQNSKSTASVLKRVFSMKCYNDSKFFERNVEKNLIRIVKKYYIKEYFEMLYEERSDEEVLNEIGIAKYPEVIEFCGNMRCNINGQEMLYNSATCGSYVNTYSIQNMQEIEILDTKRIIFIENKTNYIEYITHKKEDEFVVYHGGFYSPIKGVFFQKIYNAAKILKVDVEFYHWSDIDIGGFEIFARLRENIIPELSQYNMDKNILLANEKNWKKFNDDYKVLLLNLRRNNKYTMFFEVIDIMLENNIRLEQESLI